MGTDIHMIVEVRDSTASPWVATTGPSLMAKLANRGEIPVGMDKYVTEESFTWIYHDRNYQLFAMLADVRNGVGFAGIKTGERLNPITPERGIPVDYADNAKATYEDALGIAALSEDNMSWLGEHSFSWLKYEELIDPGYWDQVATLCGVVPLGDFDKLGGNPPSSWCGSVHGPNIETVDEKVALSATFRMNLDPVARYHVRMSWEQPYRECAGRFYAETIPQLATLSSQYGAGNVRIVFGFDS